MTLKKLALAALACAAFGGAQAAPQDLGTLNAGSSTTFSFNVASNSFDDYFNFTLGTGAFGGAGAGAIATVVTLLPAAPWVNVTTPSVTLAGALTDTTTSTLLGSDADMSDGFTFPTLVAGHSYSLHLTSGTIAGASNISGGGAISISAVPEPESYAMMLAGLGALGFMARRRKAK